MICSALHQCCVCVCVCVRAWGGGVERERVYSLFSISHGSNTR